MKKTKKLRQPGRRIQKFSDATSHGEPDYRNICGLNAPPGHIGISFDTKISKYSEITIPLPDYGMGTSEPGKRSVFFRWNVLHFSVWRRTLFDMEAEIRGPKRPEIPSSSGRKPECVPLFRVRIAASCRGRRRTQCGVSLYGMLFPFCPMLEKQRQVRTSGPAAEKASPLRTACCRERADRVCRAGIPDRRSRSPNAVSPV